VTGALDFNQPYTWWARAESQGAFGPWSGRATFTVPPNEVAGYVRGSELYDPLTKGTTIGQIHGPVQWVPDVGLKLLSESSYVSYSLPVTLREGEVSAIITNVGTISAGGVQNLTANYFKQASGLDVVIVPFRTTPDAIVALMRNDVEMVIDFYAALKSGLEDNKLRAVAWTGPQPSPALPNVPTALGEGVKGFEAASWNAIYAKAGTPPEVLATLNKAMQEVLAEPDVKKRLLDLGIDSKASTPAEMDAQMRGDITKWTEVIDRAGIEKR
jgi:hypothetical protein